MPARPSRTGKFPGLRRRCFIEQLEDRRMLTASQELVLDINTVARDGAPRPMDFVQVGTTTYFTAATETTNRELWKTDGTPQGTQLVKDIRPGREGSFPTNLTNVAGTLFFRASDDYGSGLWKSDGTSAGTSLIKNLPINALAQSQFTEVNGTAFFASSDGVNGRELWKSDGTPEGTLQVKDIYEGIGHGDPTNLINLNGTLLFQAREPSTGFELWRSDGTADGTSLVKDIDPGFLGSGSPGRMTEVNGTAYFEARMDALGRELWKTDGTTAGTVLLKDIAPGSQSSEPKNLTNVSGTLFLAAAGKLWKSDGTPEGTVLVRDTFEGSNPEWLTNASGTLFYSATGYEPGRELWRSDGTEEGTVLVKDIGANVSGDPTHLTNLNGTLLFAANDGIHWQELWTSDGSTEGTTLVKDIHPFDSSNLRDLINANGTLLFSAIKTQGYELWSSDGTTAGTVVLKEVNGGTLSSNPSELVNLNGTLLFNGSDGTSGRELWSSDGSALETTLVKAFTSGSEGGGAFGGINANGKLLFWAGSNSDSRLYASDGTSAGTLPLLNAYAFTSSFVNVNGTFFFSTRTIAGNNELWNTDGTPSGTKLVRDLGAGSQFSFPKFLTNLQGMLLFQATTDDGDSELWRSDGTSDGTQRVADIRPGSAGSEPRYLTNVAGTLYFRANDGVRGDELWRTDGTAAGTMLTADIAAGAVTSNPRFLTNVNGALFFRANDGVVGDELWMVDPTSAGARQVKDIRAGALSSDPRHFTELNGALVFSANDGVGGAELWSSDGTAAGTRPLDAIRPGAVGSNPRYLSNIHGTLFFSASDGVGGDELWMSGGTAADTHKVASASAIAPQSPHGFTLVDGTLFYAATTDEVGTELFKVVLNAPPGMSPIANLATLEDTAGSVQFSVTDEETPPAELSVLATSNNQLLLPDANITVSGSGDDRSLSFSPAADLSGVATITVRLSDGWQTVESTFVLTVEPVNDSPTELVLSSMSVAENLAQGATVGIISSVDVDWDDTFTYALVAGDGDNDNALFTVEGDTLLTASVLNYEARDSYSIRMRTTDAAGATAEEIFTISVLDANDPGNASIIGATARNELLTVHVSDEDGTSSSEFTYQWQRSIEGNNWKAIEGATASTYLLTQQDVGERIRVQIAYTDDGGTLEEIASAATGAIEHVNHAPILDTSLNPTLAPAQEDATNPASTLVSSLLVGAVADPDADARRGIAIGTTSDYHGVWEYRLNNYVEWQPVGSVSESSALLLPGWARLRFIPKADFNGTVKIYYRAWDQTQGSPGERFDLVGNTGGTNAFSIAKEAASLTVTPVNDAPKLSLSGSIGYKRDASPITLAPYASVSDIDSANFYGGQLRVRITDGESTSNRLLLGSGFSVDANNKVLQGSTIIGKRTSSGFGTNELAITFNYRVAPTIAQQLVRAITFKTKDGAAGQRTILFTLSDGDGGLSDEAMKKVNVT